MEQRGCLAAARRREGLLNNVTVARVGRHLAGVVIALAPSWVGEARANGKFPAADQLLQNPGDPSHLVLRTTFGVVMSRNAGADWDVLCEAGVGYQDYEPGVAVTSEGTLLAGLFDGVSVAPGDNCGWSITLAGNVQDVSVSRAEPGVSVAITTDATTTRVFESSDEGATFTQMGVDLPASFIGVTVDIAPSDPNRIYVSGLQVADGPDQGMIARSLDRGQSWELLPIPASDEQSVPYIGAMHPSDPGTLYVRLFTAPGRLLRSTDGGDTWLEATHGIRLGVIRGLALSADGETIFAGSEYDGLWRGPARTLQLEKVSSLAIRCLTQGSDGLYACVNEELYGDGFLVGRSGDDGETFDPLLSIACVRGVLECPSDSSVGLVCPGQWPQLASQLETDQCNAAPAGAGGGGAGGGTSAGGAGGQPQVSPPGDESCACSAPGSQRERAPLGGALSIAIAILCWGRRARRR
jgi:hypothetical protein